jgi:hypothetical protein
MHSSPHLAERLDAAGDTGALATCKRLTDPNTNSDTYSDGNSNPHPHASARRRRLCRAVERHTGLHGWHDGQRRRQQLHGRFLDAEPESNYPRK